MKETEAIRKYGKETYQKMCKFMNGITVSLDKDGEVDIPERDLELAYKQLHGYKMHPFEWDNNSNFRIIKKVLENSIKFDEIADSRRGLGCNRHVSTEKKEFICFKGQNVQRYQ